MVLVFMVSLGKVFELSIERMFFNLYDSKRYFALLKS